MRARYASTCPHAAAAVIVVPVLALAVASAWLGSEPAVAAKAHTSRSEHKRSMRRSAKRSHLLVACSARRAVAHSRRNRHKARLKRCLKSSTARTKRRGRATATKASTRHKASKTPKIASPTPASPPGSGTGWGGFGGLSLPGPSWKPYANTSPFNQSAAGAAEHPESQAIVKTVLSWGLPENLEAGNAETSEDWGHPTFWAQPGDPIYTLQATEPWGPNALNGMRIAIPEDARPAGGGDGHMTVVEPNGEEYDFWRAQAPPPGGGTFTFAWGNLVPGGLKGNGIGGGGTASGFGNLAGMIRAPELAAGHINHALFIVLKCAAPGTGFGDGAALDPPNSSYVYPANEGGSACPAGESDAPPLGTRFMLAMSDAQIKALAVPSWKKTILTALAEYGGYFGDTGGPGFTFMFESSTTYTALNLPDPLVEFAQQNELPESQGIYLFNVASGVEWEKYLRVVEPPKP